MAKSGLGVAKSVCMVAKSGRDVDKSGCGVAKSVCMVAKSGCVRHVTGMVRIT